MKLSKTLLALDMGAVISSTAFAADGDDKKAEQTTIDKVPAAVKEGINGALEGGTIKGITEKKHGDKTVYHVEITTKDGKTVSKWFDDKGAVVEHKDHKDGKDAK